MSRPSTEQNFLLEYSSFVDADFLLPWTSASFEQSFFLPYRLCQPVEADFSLPYSDISPVNTDFWEGYGLLAVNPVEMKFQERYSLLPPSSTSTTSWSVSFTRTGP